MSSIDGLYYRTMSVSGWLIRCEKSFSVILKHNSSYLFLKVYNILLSTIRYELLLTTMWIGIHSVTVYLESNFIITPSWNSFLLMSTPWIMTSELLATHIFDLMRLGLKLIGYSTCSGCTAFSSRSRHYRSSSSIGFPSCTLSPPWINTVLLYEKKLGLARGPMSTVGRLSRRKSLVRW